MCNISVTASTVLSSKAQPRFLPVYPQFQMTKRQRRIVHPNTSQPGPRNGEPFDLGDLVVAERTGVESGDVLFQLPDTTGSDQSRGDLGLAKHPGHGQLSQGLPALSSQLV